MVSTSSLKTSLIQHDVPFVNYGSIYSKIDDKALYVLVHGYSVIDTVQQMQVTHKPPHPASSKYGNFQLQASKQNPQSSGWPLG